MKDINKNVVDVLDDWTKEKEEKGRLKRVYSKSRRKRPKRKGGKKMNYGSRRKRSREEVKERKNEDSVLEGWTTGKENKIEESALAK